MRVELYLNFDGRADEAIEFYKSAVGAKVKRLVRFSDHPQAPGSGQFPAEIMNKVMHANLQIGDTSVLASDGRCQGKASYSGMTASLTLSTEAEAQRVFSALSAGGKVTMPLDKTFFSPAFGMLTDKFGVPWMVVVQ